MELHSPFEILLDATTRQGFAAVAAIFGPEVVLSAALLAMVAHLPGRHSHKIATRALNDFDISHNEFVVDRY